MNRARSTVDIRSDRCMMSVMTRRLLLVLAASTLASALPAGVALADDPPVVTAPPVVVESPTDYCNVVIVVDGPVYPDGSHGPPSTVFVPCGDDAVIPPIVIDVPASLATVAAAPVVAARLGYVPEWVALLVGSQ